MKTLAVIGAGYLQKPLIERARAMGLRTLCFAWEEGAVCRDICDVFYPISIVEKEAILAVCREEKIDGICTIASDVAAPTVAYVAEQMGLAGNSYVAALGANNKYLMRQALSGAGVDCPRYVCVHEYDEKVLGALTFPLIVKPSDRSGSLAVSKVGNKAQLQAAIKEAVRVSFKGEAMVEEFIDGREISVEMLSCKGRHYALQITDKETTGAPHFVELAHHQPSNLPQEKQDAIYAITMRALDALALTNGASHAEYKITAEGRVVVMEIGGRMGGDFIGSDLVRLSTGYDFVRGVIEVALGMDVVPVKTKNAYSGVHFLSAETPEVQSYITHASKYSNIVCAEQTDTQIRALTCSGDRSGYFIYCDSTRRFETLRGKTVMVLGGGRYQYPLIQTARASGCRVVVLGYPGDYPGYALASQWYDVDIMDAAAVIGIAKSEQIDAIVGCGSDFILPTIGKVVDALGLLGPTYESSVVSSNKLLMKNAFSRAGVRTAAYREICSEESMLRAATELGYPVVLKIVDGSGSKGVVVCHDEKSLHDAYTEALSLTHADSMVLEQFVDGEEFGAQAYVRDGRLQFTMLHGDLIYHGASGIPVGHFAPYSSEKSLQADVEEQLRKCIAALQIDNCAINADFILSDGKVYVLEIGARAGATCLPELVSECFGINYYEYILCGACGLPLPQLPAQALYPALVFTPFSTQTGVVKGRQIPSCKEVVVCDIYPQVGEEVHAFRTAYDRIGHLVMRGETMSGLLRVYEKDIQSFPFVTFD